VLLGVVDIFQCIQKQFIEVLLGYGVLSLGCDRAKLDRNQKFLFG
jgi:hypothetical protein